MKGWVPNSNEGAAGLYFSEVTKIFHPFVSNYPSCRSKDDDWALLALKKDSYDTLIFVSRVVLVGVTLASCVNDPVSPLKCLVIPATLSNLNGLTMWNSWGFVPRTRGKHWSSFVVVMQRINHSSGKITELLCLSAGFHKANTDKQKVGRFGGWRWIFGSLFLFFFFFHFFGPIKDLCLNQNGSERKHVFLFANGR